MGMKEFFKNAFGDIKESAKQQHEVDKANFAAVKAESKANFEENRGSKTFAKAKADAKKSWHDAHMIPAERNAQMKEERERQIAEANKRKAEADARIVQAKQSK